MELLNAITVNAFDKDDCSSIILKYAFKMFYCNMYFYNILLFLILFNFLHEKKKDENKHDLHFFIKKLLLLPLVLFFAP